MTKTKFVVVLAMVGILLLSAVGVCATGFDGMDSVMTISPPNQRIVLIPGETFEGSIRVSNSANAKQNLEYSVSIGSYGLLEGEDGRADYTDIDLDTVTNYNQMMSWIKLGKESGRVAPNSFDTIPFTIVVPEDAPAGGQYATIIVQDDTVIEGGGGDGLTIQNIVRFAADIIAEVAGQTREEGEILENSVPSFVLSNQLAATSLVKNSGNVHTDAKYILQVWPLIGNEEVCTNEEDPSTSLIMPETERYHTESCTLPAVGIFRVKQTVSIFGEMSVMEKVIVVCPLWLLFLIILVIVAIIIYLVAQTKARKNKNEA